MSFSRFDNLLDHVEDNGLLENSLGDSGMDGVYHTAAFASLGRAGLLLNQEELGPDTNERLEYLMNTGAAHANDSNQPTEMANYMSAVGGATGTGADLRSKAQAGINPATQALFESLEDTQIKVAVCNEQRALQRGDTTSGGGEGANDFDFKKEAEQTQGYVQGVLDNHNAILKTTLTSTLPSIGATAKSFKETINTTSTALEARASFVEDSVKSLTNALASTTISKVTGVELDRVFESYIKVAKFSLFKSGSSLALEAPSTRVSGQLVTLQGNLVVTEADDINFVGQWLNQQLKQSWILGTKTANILAKDNFVISAGTAKYYGQTGVTIGDKAKLIAGVADAGGLSFDSAGNALLVNKEKLQIKLGSSGTLDLLAEKGAQVQLTKDGNLKQQAKSTMTSKAKTVEVIGNDKVVIKVGGSSIVVSSSKIDLNPSSAPSVSDLTLVDAEDVPVLDIVFANPPEPVEQPQRKASQLPAKGKRNSLPANLPYSAG
jgi:hypothetical protein